MHSASPMRLICVMLQAALLFYLGGCIAIPRHAELREGDQVLSEDTLEFLETSQSTKMAVTERLGDPMVESEDGRVYMYLSAWRTGAMDYHMFNPVAVMVVSGAALFGQSVDFDALPPSHRLIRADSVEKSVVLIEFNEDDSVVRAETYEFATEVMPSQMVEDWRTDPLPWYFSRK